MGWEQRHKDLALDRGQCCVVAGAMKAKELTAFLKKYALDSPAQEPDASNQESAEKPESDAEESEDPKGKAVPQAGPISQDILA